MNTRILELIKNPEIIQLQDLSLLTAELEKIPYLQSMRALHLYGTHLYDQDNYQKNLSVTAAYTTDKKILYQFINKNTATISTEPTRSDEEIDEVQVEKVERENLEIEEKTSTNVFTEIEPIPLPTAKPILVDGVLNRILFEGEEDFLERDHERIDLQSTIESGKIVTETVLKEKISEDIELIKKPEFFEADDAENYSKEEIINEEEINEEETEIKSAEVSFHGLEEFLPEVKIKGNSSEAKNFAVPKVEFSKSELEMQRLIAEVEAKMKSSKKEKIQQEEPVLNKEVNFSETQNFDILSSQKELPAPKDSVKTTTKPQIISGEKQQEVGNWKPMNFSGNIPDSLIEKDAEEKHVVQAKNISSETLEIQEESLIIEEKLDERPVFNASFFTQNVSPIESKKTETEEVQNETKIDEVVEESNVPNFINTWQNWLKIERIEPNITEKPPISKIEVKKSVIENFIEKEPKISKLKEESDFVVKEKGNNISHLMTETLAKLYVEQKLYAKAIKAYEILAEKHPQKVAYFEDKILEIKELRKNL